MTDAKGPSVVAESELLRLEREMHALAWDDPERPKVVRLYNALCARVEVPSGDK